MENSKLLGLLRELDQGELQALKKFLDSPYYNSNAEITQLYSLLYTYRKRAFRGNVVFKERIFKKIYPPNTPYDDHRIRLLMSEMVKKVKKFLALQAYEQDAFAEQWYLSKKFKEKKLMHHYQNTITKLIDHLLQIQPKNGDHFAILYFLQQDWVTSDPMITENVAEVQKIFDYLDVFYANSKLLLATEALSRAKFRKEEYTIRILQPVQNELASALLELYPNLEIYKQLLHILQNFDEQIYIDLIASFFKNANNIDKKQQSEILFLLLNLGAEAKRNNVKNATILLFRLYQFGLDNKVLLEYSTPEQRDVLCMNIVSTASICHQFTWLEGFLNQQKAEFIASGKEDIYVFCLAQMYYVKSVFEKNVKYLNLAAESIQETRFINANLNYRSKLMLTKIYYELLATEEEIFSLSHFDGFCKVFKQFITRQQKISDLKKDTYTCFVDYVRKLAKFKCKQDKSKTEINTLAKNINQEEQLFNKKWLLEKVGELSEDQLPT